MSVSRRLALAFALLLPVRRADAADAADFMARAFAMRRRAEAAGDQPYGAVVARGGIAVGEAASEVVLRRDPDAHAERLAIADAQRRLGTQDLGGAVLFSSSRPCASCEAAAARAGIARMIHGAALTDAGAPGKRTD